MTNTPQHPIAGSGDSGDKSELDELRELLEESRAEIRLLQQINSSLVSSSSLDEILQSIVGGLTGTLGYNTASIWMLDDDGMTLRCQALAAGTDLSNRFEKATGAAIIGYGAPIFEESVIWPVVTNGKSLVTDDVAAVLAGFSQDDYLLSLASKAAAASGIVSVI